MSLKSNTRLKVLVIAPSLSKRAGGGRLAREIVSRLRDSVELVTLAEKGDGTGDLGEKIVLDPRSSAKGFLHNCLIARREARTCDIVHAFDAWPYAVYGLFAVFGTRRKLFINGVGTYSVVPLMRRKTRFLVRAAYKRASETLCISAYTKRRIDEQLPGLRTSVMHMGTTLLPLPDADKVKKLKEKLSVPPDAYPIITTVGEIKERKGQLDTLKGLLRCKDLFPQALYIIAGRNDDEYVEEIRTTAKEYGQNIRISSDVNTDEDLACLYSIADLFALNSNNHEEHFEGFGLVILEAAQFGVPAIGSRDCGIEDAIDDGVSGVLVGQGDHEGIAKAMRAILGDTEKFKAGALAWYTRFSWENTITKILEAYDQS
jgi:glycosyltransferase involved in cell wall biosynthesis